MRKVTAQQILKASSGLLGFCFIIIVVLFITNKGGTRLFSISVSFISLLLLSSSVLALLSLKISDVPKRLITARLANYLFIAALVLIIIAALYSLLHF